MTTNNLEERYPPKENCKKAPFGYFDPDENKISKPNWEIIHLLEEAFDYLDEGKSYREVQAWLHSKTNKSLSHNGLRLLWQKHRPNSPQITKRRKEHYEKRRNTKKNATKAEKLLAARKRKIRNEKLRLTNTIKRIESLEGEIEEINREQNPLKITEVQSSPSLNWQELDYSEVEESEKEEEQEVIFQPNPGPQTAFLASDELEVLYGGSAGGGKSYAILADPMRYFENKDFMGLILRRTNDELRELIRKSQELYPKAIERLFGIPESEVVKKCWREKDKEWRFPSGGRLWFTYLEDDKDVWRYQGQSFTYVAFDELTQYPTPYAWNYLRSRLRTTSNSNIPVYMRGTTNPGGPGHGWVKRMFIDPAPPGKSFWAKDLDNDEVLSYPKGHEKEGQPLFKRKFIPARLSDNPYLAEDGNYEMNLLSLPEHQRRQLLEGDWSVAEGAAFSEFRPDIHTCKPFEIPPTWKRFRSCDFGYSSHSAVHWFAIDPSYETLYVYRELYVSKKTGRELAKMVLDAERHDGRIMYGILDSSVWHVRGQSGPSIAEEMIAEGCRWRPSDRSQGSRIAGKNRLHELLIPRDIGDGEVRPGIIFFDNCRQIIADLPVIPMDPKGGEDIDDRYTSDHTYDSIRYGIMSRPRSFSPFETFSQNSPVNTFRPMDQRFGY